jgi:murein L,D-transpeptidase YcbB/YkuD
MVAVVGSPSDPTPVFSDVLTYLEFHPTWGIPRSILEREMLPKYKRDRHFFENNKMRVFDTAAEIPEEVDPHDVPWDSVATDSFRYVVRQDAGRANPLGLVKFMCPNEYDVYLHDTPARRQFRFASRFLSHGCIRVQDPAALARYLLKGTRLAAPESLRAILADSAWRQVSLKRRIPVLVEYRTAWVDDDGTLQFRPDVYGLDRRLGEALRSGQLSTFDLNAGVARNPRMKVTTGWNAYRSQQ